MTFHEFAAVFVWVWIPLVIVDFYVAIFVEADAKERWDFFFPPVYSLGLFLFAVDNLQQRRWWMVAMCMFFAVWAAWMWWHNDQHRRRRKRLLERGYGRVVDAGGRLKVVRPLHES